MIRSRKAPVRKQSKRQCSRKPNPKNQKMLNNVVNHFCVDDIEKNPTYMAIWENIMAAFDDSCLEKLSKMSNAQLDKYGISKDVFQYNQPLNDATRFRRACRQAIAGIL